MKSEAFGPRSQLGFGISPLCSTCTQKWPISGSICHQEWCQHQSNARFAQSACAARPKEASLVFCPHPTNSDCQRSIDSKLPRRPDLCMILRKLFGWYDITLRINVTARWIKHRGLCPLISSSFCKGEECSKSSGLPFLQPGRTRKLMAWRIKTFDRDWTYSFRSCRSCR